MKILFSVHMWPPMHLAGGELYALKLAKMLQEQGHAVRVYMHRYWNSPDTDHMYTYDGIDVWPPMNDQVKEELFRWADIFITHLDFAKYTIEKAKLLGGKPVIFLVHNTSRYYDSMINDNSNTFVIYNAEHAREELKYQRPHMVLEPQIYEEKVKADNNTHQYITLVNLCENKGVRQFYEIARQMPDRKFLGVIGSYMDQELDCPPNVTIWEKQTDMRKVYGVTDVLLMPSDYESYGLVASEAMANGIPVICSPTPGLKENCGNGAQFVDRDDAKKYISLIRQLESPTHYKKWSQAALRKASTRQNRGQQLQTFINECGFYCKTG